MLVVFTDMNLLLSLLRFATRLEAISPIGFQPTPFITFGHDALFDKADHRKGLPIVSTCTLCLQLPVLQEFETFKNILINCIENVTIFTAE